MFHHVLHVALDDGVVDGIHPGGCNADTDLTGSELGLGQITHRARPPELLDGISPHW